MKPPSYFAQIRIMPNKADQFELRLRIVQPALACSVKPTVRLFDTTAKTVRKWLARYRQERLAGLNELPRMPLKCPHKTPAVLAGKIVKLRKQFPFQGPQTPQTTA
jgi:transposase-like protein